MEVGWGKSKRHVARRSSSRDYLSGGEIPGHYPSRNFSSRLTRAQLSVGGASLRVFPSTSQLFPCTCTTTLPSRKLNVRVKSQRASLLSFFLSLPLSHFLSRFFCGLARLSCPARPCPTISHQRLYTFRSLHEIMRELACNFPFGQPFGNTNRIVRSPRPTYTSNLSYMTSLKWKPT